MANLRVDKITSTETFETTGSVQFDGSGDRLSASSSDFSLDGDFTVEYWIQSQNNTGNSGYVLHFGGGNTSYFGTKSGSYVLQANNNGEHFWTGVPTINTWVHLALVRSGSTVTLYEDGISLGNKTESQTFGNSTFVIADWDGQFPVTGYISNFRILKGTALYTSNFKPPMRELEVTPETVLLACQHKTDASHEKTGKTITVTGNAVASELTPGLLTDVVKSGGSSAITGSVEFDGTGDYLTVPSSTDLEMGTGDFTVEMWVYSTDSSQDTQDRRFFATEDNATSSIQIGHINTTAGIVEYADQGSLNVRVTGTTDIRNQWAHIAVVRNSGTVSLYVNGVSEGTPATDSNSKTASTPTIGKYPGASGHFKGFMSNLRLVKGTALYTDNFIPPTRELKKVPGTVLLCCQDENSVTTEATGKTITSNGDPATSNFTPQVGNDGSVEFVGPIKINTENYFYLPTGDTESRGSYNAGTRGLNGGGYGNSPLTNLNIIDYITIATTSNAQDFGDLTTKRHVLTACSSSTRGVFGGGRNPALLNVMDYVTIASTGDAQDFGDLSQARSSNGACSSSTRGVFGGGIRLASPLTNSNVIDYITIASLGDAQDFGDLIEERRGTVSCSSPTRGVWGGNITPSLTNTLEYITISSTGDAQDFGDLIQAIAYPGFCSSSTRGVLGGAYSPALSNTISFITISTTGNAQDFGDLTQARGYVSGACSSSIRGVWMGGYTTTVVNTIDYVTISSTGNAVDFGDVTEDTNGNAACSNGHGGLG